MNLAVPVEGVPVGLSLMASDAASGTIEIKDSYTMGVDTISLYRQLGDWAKANTDFLGYFGPGGKQTNYLRVVTRIYATGKMSVSLTDASSRSGGLDVGVPKPVNLLRRGRISELHQWLEHPIANCSGSRCGQRRRRQCFAGWKFASHRCQRPFGFDG
jgi:hypothetical protein